MTSSASASPARLPRLAALALILLALAMALFAAPRPATAAASAPASAAASAPDRTGERLSSPADAQAPAGAPPSITLAGAPVLDRMLYVNIGGKPWGLCGACGFCLAGRSYDAGAAVWFLYMMVFMDTAATIPTGAAAERWRFKSFTIFSL